MKFTKILAILLVLMMVVSAVACNTNNGNNQSSETESTDQKPFETTEAKAEEAKTETKTENTTKVEKPTTVEDDTSVEETTTAEEITSVEETSQPDEQSTENVGDIKVLTVAEALDLCGDNDGDGTGEERYYIRAIIKTVLNAAYGEMIVYDETGEIYVYGTYSSDGSLKFSELEDKPVKGDEVLLHCVLQNYQGTKEVKNARLIEFTSNQENVDVSDYTPATLEDARAAEIGAKLKVSGIVARITYATGMKPSGFILVDGATSIYVYDGDAAAQVAIGNRVEIAASKTYWILDAEQSYAATFGYKGCNQLENVTLVSNDKGNNEWINDAIPTATVKEIMDNPIINDITTQVYKVTALIKKSPGDGFINYYIDDLDGQTGSYAYTQCNGSDFAWLDEFDGKICTVYLTVINAKSTSSGCLYRLLPVKVVDEGFTFNKDNAAEHAVKYYGVVQFESLYTGDPALELITSVSSELLGFENATLSYSSSDESVITITSTDGKTIMNCLESGTATIAVTGSYNGKTFSENVTVTVDIPTVEIPYISVGEAISTAAGTDVTVKGIVGPSLINQTGFYLIDESGVIAVRSTSAVLATLKLGNEVIIKGTRKLSKDTDGQICIDSAELVQNNYGEHEYSTVSFITGKTVSDIVALDGAVEHTVEVYVVTATIRRETTKYSTDTYVGDGTSEFMLYAGGPAQYAWLSDYLDQTVTVAIAVCDWNNKGNKGSVLSVETADGTVVYNTYNFAN